MSRHILKVGTIVQFKEDKVYGVVVKIDEEDVDAEYKIKYFVMA